MVTFGELFADYDLANTLESLAGTLKAGKRRKFWHYGPELLLQGLSDKVEISLLGENIEDGPSPIPKPHVLQQNQAPKPQPAVGAPAAAVGCGAITAACSDCGRHHRIRQELAGKKIRCKDCNVVFTVMANE